MPIDEAQAAITEEILPFLSLKRDVVSNAFNGAVNKAKIQWSSTLVVPTELAKTEAAYLKLREEPVKGLTKLAALEVMSYKRERTAMGFSRLKFYERQAVMRRSLRGNLSTREEAFAKLIV